MSVILRPEFPGKGCNARDIEGASCQAPDCDCAPKPHRISISGANALDIALVANSVDLIFNLAISALQGQLENLRENLPISSVNNFKDIYAQLRDLRSEVLGRLEQIEGELS